MSGRSTKAYDRLMDMAVRANQSYNVAREKFDQEVKTCDAIQAAFRAQGLHEHAIKINTLREVAVEVFGKSETAYLSEVHAACKQA